MIVSHLGEVVSALVVHATLEADSGGFRLRRLEVVAVVDVHHRAAVRYHVAFESPFAAKLVLQQKLVGAGWLAVDAVVSAHHGVGLGLGHCGAKGGQIGIHFVVLAHSHVGHVPCGFRPAVYGKVLGGRDDAVVVRIVALHAGDEGNAHPRGQERVFAISLLAAAPTRIAEDVDVGRPEVQPFKDVAVPGTHILHMLDAALGADGYGHFVNLRRIECRRQTDRLRKLCGSIHRDAVQRLAPPIVRWNIEPRNGPRLVQQLCALLFERHPAHQVRRTLLRRQAGVQIRGLRVRRLLRILCPGYIQPTTTRQSCRHYSQSHDLHRIPHRRIESFQVLCRRETFIRPQLANPNAPGKWLSSGLGKRLLPNEKSLYFD